MFWRRVVEPVLRPVSLAEAKEHLRYEDSADDALILALIDAATNYAETFCRRQIMPATFRMTLDRFPGTPETIVLPRPPLGRIVSIEYADSSGTLQTLALTSYQVDAEMEPARLTPAWGYTWPSTYDRNNAVRVTYTAGYGSQMTGAGLGTATGTGTGLGTGAGTSPYSSLVPETLKLAIKMLACHWYEHRGPTDEAATVREVPMAVTALLWMHRIAEGA